MAKDCAPCRGGGPRKQRLSAVVRGGSPSGGYPLAGYPDCTNMHTGQFAGDSVIVIGRLTQGERMFRRRDIDEADAYAKSTRLTIESIPTTALCDRAVVDLFTAVK